MESRYWNLVTGTAFFACGSLTSGRIVPLAFAPLVVMLAAYPLIRGRLGDTVNAIVSRETIELTPGEREGEHQMTQDVGSAPFFIGDCKTTMLDARTHQPRSYQIGAEGLAYFCQRGWQYNFAIRKLKGLEFRDSKRTKVTGAYWTQATDILAECHLILKESNRPIRSLVGLDRLLRSVLPEPFPSGWHGWLFR